MAIDAAMREELAQKPEVVALACMDTRSGLVIGMEVREEAERDSVEFAAMSATQLCSVPGTDSDVDEAVDECFLVSKRWVHAYARVPKNRDLVVLSMAPGDANVALFRTWLRHVAERVGPDR